jgi:hypothetical protein
MRSKGLLKKRMADVVREATVVAIREFEERHRDARAEDVATLRGYEGRQRAVDATMGFVPAAAAAVAPSTRVQPAQAQACSAASSQCPSVPPVARSAAWRVEPTVYLWSGIAALPATVYADAHVTIGWAAPGRVLASSTGRAAVWHTHAAHSGEVACPLGQRVPLRASACAVVCGSGAWQLTASIVDAGGSVPVYNVSVVKPSALGTDNVTMVITVVGRSRLDRHPCSILSMC